jgi:hypothetical protein
MEYRGPPSDARRLNRNVVMWAPGGPPVFDHPNVQTYRFEDIPLDRDLSLMDVKWMAEYEAALVSSVSETSDSAYTVGYYSHAAVRASGTDFIELSWYPNSHDRWSPYYAAALGLCGLRRKLAI